jgi:hypothetical protein
MGKQAQRFGTNNLCQMQLSKPNQLSKRGMTNKSLIKVVAILVACLSFGAGVCHAFQYASAPGALIHFNGDSTVTFSPGSSNLVVTTGTAAGLSGEITGTYTIGAVTTFGFQSTAPMTGTGTFVIHDVSGDFTATLEWIEVSQFGAFGGFNGDLNANMSAVTYTGSNPDLVALKNANSGINSLSFQFTSVISLQTLKDAPAVSSFSGSITFPSPPPCICTLTFTAPNLTVCAGDAIPDATASQDCGSGPTSVPVTVTGAVTNGGCPQIITRTNTAVDGCGTTHTQMQTITVNCLPDCTITTSVSTTTAGTTNLHAWVADAGPGATYVWNILNGTITGGQGTTNITWTAGTDTSSPISITVKVISAAGCQNNCTASVGNTPNPPACTITGVTISDTSWNKFTIPSGTAPSVWVHAHIGGLKGVPTNGVTTVQFVGVTISLNGTPYALPDGVMIFDPAAPAAIATSFSGGKWITTVNPSHLSDEMFFTGAAIPVTASIAAGAKATVTYTTLASVQGLSFNWQWSAAVYTYWPADWNQAMIQPYHQSYHAGTPLNTTVQKSLIQGPRGGGGSNFTGSWSATGNAACQ